MSGKIRHRSLALAAVFFMLAVLSIVLRPDPSAQHSASIYRSANAAEAKTRPAGGGFADYEVTTVEGLRVDANTVIGGTVIPVHEVTLTAQLSGTVTWLGGQEGDEFTENTVLIEIEADELKARREALLAQLFNAEADIRNARVQYEREVFSPRSRSISRSGGMGLPMMFDQVFTKPMADIAPGTTSGSSWMDRRADLYSYGTQLDQAEGRYHQINSQIDEIEARIADSISYTPFPGVIVDRMVEMGDNVQMGQPLMRYADFSRMQIEARVPASTVLRMDTGMFVPVYLGDAGYSGMARVTRIYPVADSRQRTVTVKLDLAPNSRAIPGMYAELYLPGKDQEVDPVPVIPLRAVNQSGSLPTVKVVTENGQTQLRMIRLGEQMPDGRVTILSGLAIGERILRKPD